MAKTYKPTGINNLDLHVETETYYARIKKDGNTIRHALGKNREVAKRLKNEWIEEQRGKNSKVEGSLGSLVEKYYKWLEQQRAFKELVESTRAYKLECFSGIRCHCNGFDAERIGSLTKGDLNTFKLELIEAYGPARVNGSITVLREMLKLAVENILRGVTISESRMRL